MARNIRQAIPSARTSNTGPLRAKARSDGRENGSAESGVATTGLTAMQKLYFSNDGESMLRCEKSEIRNQRPHSRLISHFLNSFTSNDPAPAQPALESSRLSSALPHWRTPAPLRHGRLPLPGKVRDTAMPRRNCCSAEWRLSERLWLR